MGEGQRESLMHIEIDRQTEPANWPADRRRASARARRRARLRRDWTPCVRQDARGRRRTAVAPMPVDDARRVELQEFLRWAADDHFTFLGYREYTVAKQGKDEVLVAVPAAAWACCAARTASQAAPAEVAGRAHACRSRRRRCADPDQDQCALDRASPGLHGLHRRAALRRRTASRWASNASSACTPPAPTPVGPGTSRWCAKRHEYVMRAPAWTAQPQRQGAAPHPRNPAARRTVPVQRGGAVPTRHGHPRPAGARAQQAVPAPRPLRPLFLRLVYIPRDRFSTQVRHRIEAMLKRALDGERVDTNVSVGESPLARLHIIVRPKAGRAGRSTMCASSKRSWPRSCATGATNCASSWWQKHGEEPAQAGDRFGKRAAGGLHRGVTPRIAAADVEHLARCRARTTCACRCTAPRKDGGACASSCSARGRDIALSDALPMMENMGLRVISEHPYKAMPPRAGIHIQDFEVEPLQGELSTRCARASRRAFARSGAATPRTTASTAWCWPPGCSWQQVAMLRGYCKYLLQTGVPFSQSLHGSHAARYPLLARLLVELFEARFDPAPASESAAEIKLGHGALRRSQLTALAAGDEAALAALKAWSSEIFVYCRRACEGVHLRFGQGRPRRPALVRPPRGLPHRGAGPGEGADGEERRDRAGGRQGRLLVQAACPPAATATP
jgi:glutamate dehydrogenase